MSVVVPCHNYGRYLGEAIDSILAQLRPVDQIAIVNDGSTDESSSIIRTYRDRHPALVVVEHARPLGLNGARNAGVRATTAEYVCILDADDRLDRRFVDACLAALHDGMGFAYPATRFFGAFDHVAAPPPFNVARLSRYNLFTASSMFSRAMFDDIGGFDRRLDGIGLDDWEFWIRAVKAGWVGVPAPQAVLEYRQHPGSLGRVSALRLIRAHIAVHRLHPDFVGRRDLFVGTSRGVGVVVYQALKHRIRPSPSRPPYDPV